MRRYNYRVNERLRLSAWEQEQRGAAAGCAAAALVPADGEGLSLENARLLILADLYRRLAERSAGRIALAAWGGLSQRAQDEARQLGCFISDLEAEVPLLCVEARDYAHLSRSRQRQKTLLCGRLFNRSGLSTADLLPDFGADAIRIGLLALGPPQRDLVFKYDVLGAGFRFVQRLWRLAQEAGQGGEALNASELQAQVEERLAQGKPHTALAAIMGTANRLKRPNPAAPAVLAQLVEPFAPFIASALLEFLAVPALQDDQGGDGHSADS